MCAKPYAGGIQAFQHSSLLFHRKLGNVTLQCCVHTCRCVREVYGIAKTNWDAFIGPDIVDLYGHLLIYPMVVNKDGRCICFAHLFWLPSALCQPDRLDITPLP